MLLSLFFFQHAFIKKAQKNRITALIDEAMPKIEKHREEQKNKKKEAKEGGVRLVLNTYTCLSAVFRLPKAHTHTHTQA